MSSHPKRAAAKAKPKTTARPKKSRTILDTTKVRFLSKTQARAVIIECGVYENPSDELVENIHFQVNKALDWLKPKNKARPTTDFKDIQSLLKKLQLKLTPDNVALLSELSAAKKKSFSAFKVLTDPASDHLLADFKMTTNIILSWLADRKACNLVLASLKPMADAQIVAGHLLPDVFQTGFFRKFGSGSSGPGNRFVVAVMREAGIVHHDEETTAQYVREARRRMLMLPPLMTS